MHMVLPTPAPEDDGHAVMEPHQLLARVGGHNGEGVRHVFRVLLRGVLPRVPQPRELVAQIIVATEGQMHVFP